MSFAVVPHVASDQKPIPTMPPVRAMACTCGQAMWGRVSRPGEGQPGEEALGRSRGRAVSSLRLRSPGHTPRRPVWDTMIGLTGGSWGGGARPQPRTPEPAACRPARSNPHAKHAAHGQTPALPPRRALGGDFQHVPHHLLRRVREVHHPPSLLELLHQRPPPLGQAAALVPVARAPGVVVVEVVQAHQPEPRVVERLEVGDVPLERVGALDSQERRGEAAAGRGLLLALVFLLGGEAAAPGGHVGVEVRRGAEEAQGAAAALLEAAGAVGLGEDAVEAAPKRVEGVACGGAGGVRGERAGMLA